MLVRLEDSIDSSSFNESVTVLGGHDIHVTPLGIYVADGLLKAKIYPGTRLRDMHEEYYEACISFPFTAEPYYEAVMFREKLRLRRAKTLHTPCPDYPSIAIEAVIARRARTGEFIILTFEPIEAYVHGSPVAYRRSLGCSIELLIALTRLQYYSSIRSHDCKFVRRLMVTVLTSYDCILHSTRNPTIHQYAWKAARRAANLAMSTGCISEKELENLM